MNKGLFWGTTSLHSVHAFISAAELVPAEEKSPALTFHVETQDLYLDQNSILVNVDGHAYEVSSLEKNGNRWVVRITSKGTCPWGHSLCNHCGLCHTRICPTYQSRCSKSK